MKISILVLVLVSAFLSDVQALTIYKYHDSKKPRCANIATGQYLNMETHFEIGFGDDSLPADPTVSVISPEDFAAWVIASGGTQKEADDLLLKLESLSHKKIDGKVLTKKRDVILNASRKSAALFSDPKGVLTPMEFQVRLISQVISILTAYVGIIDYKDVGVLSITDKASADSYVTTNLLPLWLQTFQIKAEAEKYISDNKLE